MISASNQHIMHTLYLCLTTNNKSLLRVKDFDVNGISSLNTRAYVHEYLWIRGNLRPISRKYNYKISSRKFAIQMCFHIPVSPVYQWCMVFSGSFSIGWTEGERAGVHWYPYKRIQVPEGALRSYIMLCYW